MTKTFLVSVAREAVEWVLLEVEAETAAEAQNKVESNMLSYIEELDGSDWDFMEWSSNPRVFDVMEEE